MIDIKKLIENASLGDYLTIGGFAFSGIVTAFALWRKYKNRYVEIRKAYLKKINVTYHLFQRGRNFIYIPERNADSARLIQDIDASIDEIQDYHSDHPEALEKFDSAYSDLTALWYTELNLHWQQWCDSSRGSAYMGEGTRNWNAFSISRFYNMYDFMRGKLNILREQVEDSIP